MHKLKKNIDKLKKTIEKWKKTMEQSKKTIEQVKKTIEKLKKIIDKPMRTMENSIKTIEKIMKPVEKIWTVRMKDVSYKIQHMRDFSCKNQGREPGQPKKIMKNKYANLISPLIKLFKLFTHGSTHFEVLLIRFIKHP